jgi:signal transduction histidine kinase
MYSTANGASPASNNAWVRITVADDGPGIEREHLPQLFEPFFSTKPNTGTGLGLWVSREIAEKHGGHIRFRSSTSPDRHYTAAFLLLPAHTEAAKEAPHHAAANG